MCIKKECLFHSEKKNNFVSTNIVGDQPLVDDDTIKWICINNNCVYHNKNIVEYDDQDEKVISNNISEEAVVKK